MVAFFEDRTALKFDGGLAIPDTYGHLPGAGTGGRSVIARPFDARKLGPALAPFAQAAAGDELHGHDDPGGQ